MPETRRFITEEQFVRLAQALNALTVTGVANCLAIAQAGTIHAQVEKQVLEEPKDEAPAEADQKVLPFKG